MICVTDSCAQRELACPLRPLLTRSVAWRVPHAHALNTSSRARRAPCSRSRSRAPCPSPSLCSTRYGLTQAHRCAHPQQLRITFMALRRGRSNSLQTQACMPLRSSRGSASPCGGRHPPSPPPREAARAQSPSPTAGPTAPAQGPQAAPGPQVAGLEQAQVQALMAPARWRSGGGGR